MNANEIIEMIKEVSDFQLWASRLTERAKEKRQFIQFRDEHTPSTGML